MKDLLNEIQQHFAAGNRGIRQIRNLPNESPAYTFRGNNEFGVALEFSNAKKVYEEASNVVISTRDLLFSGQTKTLLLLTCCDEQFRNEFADICVRFVEPGNNNSNRKRLLESPIKWWEQWIGLLGNRVGSRKSYDTIAEMMALEDLYKNDKTIKWTAAQAGSHDIESDTKSFEIKSTLKKSETKVTISSQFQLDSVNELQLWFYRMEKSEQGFS